MAQWVKSLLEKQDPSLEPQNHVNLDIIVCMCTSGTTTVRWETETGCLEVFSSDSQAYYLAQAGF